LPDFLVGQGVRSGGAGVGQLRPVVELAVDGDGAVKRRAGERYADFDAAGGFVVQRAGGE